MFHECGRDKSKNKVLFTLYFDTLLFLFLVFLVFPSSSSSCSSSSAFFSSPLLTGAGGGAGGGGGGGGSVDCQMMRAEKVPRLG